ncbi:hypothetical protein ES319_A07G199900v1 [Gossypium barbadense]|uniref:Uncharacterized protein n=1 Tax=Gossypium barbadense TaxID=3634 RepID=A0A5J5V5T8_GOSBA|nr:hypothetical protein ES319_A07G199900v1 [Gossypium barbadense]
MYISHTWEINKIQSGIAYNTIHHESRNAKQMIKISNPTKQRISHFIHFTELRVTTNHPSLLTSIPAL